jgi:hypothetical protein
VNANTTFYAQWLSVPIEPPGATLAEKLAYIRNNAGDGVVYNIVVNSNEYIGPQTVSTMGRNITVNIHSASSSDVKSVQLESAGHLFSVDTNITLKLQDIVLKGISTNNRALVLVGQGGKLILNSGAKVTLNTNTGYSGGVHVNGGVLELNDGSEITGNVASAVGGGVFVINNGSVVIHGGIISENTAKYGSSSPYWNSDYGGGIYIAGNSLVSMAGGVISKNIAGGTWGRGGGIYVENGSSFTKRAISGSSTSGIIYGGTAGVDANTAGINGQAIYRDFGTLKNRNTTLSYYDEISTNSDEGWE